MTPTVSTCILNTDSFKVLFGFRSRVRSRTGRGTEGLRKENFLLWLVMTELSTQITFFGMCMRCCSRSWWLFVQAVSYCCQREWIWAKPDLISHAWHASTTGSTAQPSMRRRWTPLFSSSNRLNRFRASQIFRRYWVLVYGCFALCSAPFARPVNSRR